MFSVKCPVCLLELNTPKHLMICKKYAAPLVSIDTFSELSDKTHIQCLYLQQHLDERKVKESAIKPTLSFQGLDSTN